MTEFKPLVEGEFLVPVSDELLFRQITDVHWDEVNKIPGSPAFGPASIDKGKASFARASVVSAQESRDWHSEHASKPSRGVWACSSEEVESAGTRSVDDGKIATAHPKSPGHCYVDYRHMSKPEERLVRAELLALAIGRGEVRTGDPADHDPR